MGDLQVFGASAIVAQLSWANHRENGGFNGKTIGKP